MAWTSFGAYGEKIKIVLDGNDDIGDDDDMDCKKCGHSWKPIVEKPLKCPACNQPKYWLEKVRNRDEGGSDKGCGSEGSGVRSAGGGVHSGDQGRRRPVPAHRRQQAVGPVAPVEHGPDAGARGDAEAVACPECHYLNGCHAKKCSKK